VGSTAMPSDSWEELRERIIGMGETSIRKGYYAELQKRVAELEHANRSLQLLAAVHQALLHAEDDDGLLRGICEALTRVGGYPVAIACSIAGGSGPLRPMAGAGLGADVWDALVMSWDEARAEGALAREALRSRQKVLVQDVVNDPRLLEQSAALLHAGARALLLLPLFEKGEPLGVLIIASGREGFDERASRLLGEVADELAFGLSALHARAAHSCAAAAVREREAKLRAIFDAALDLAIVVVDRTRDGFPIVEFSPGAERIFGYAREEVLGQSVAVLHGAQSAESLAAIHGRLVKTVRSVSEELRLARKGGETFYALHTTYPLLDEDGQAAALVCTSIDISERRRMEQALRESEERFRVLVEESPGIFFYQVDAEARFTYLSPSVERLTGYPARALLGRKSFELDSSPTGVSGPPERWLGSRTAALPATVTIKGRDGRERVFDVLATPLVRAGQVVGAQGIARDVTARVRAEQASRTERAMLSAAVDILPFAVYFVAPGGEVLLANRAARGLLERTRAGPSAGDVALLESDSQERVPPDALPAARALGGQVVAGAEKVLAMPGGRRVPVLVSAAPVRVDDQLVAAVVAFQDVTALKEADRAKDEFLMALSHELRTPLTRIIGWAQVAQRTPEVTPRALSLVLRNAREQKSALERLLTLSRLSSGREALRRETVDLWRLVSTVTRPMASEAAEAGLAVELQPPSEPLLVEGDPALLAQAVTELFDNARKFTPVGGAIGCMSRRTDGEAVLVVSDTGRGIDPEELGGLERPFRQLQREEGIAGFGVGLALARAIAKAHGGFLRLSSEGLGKGTTVTLVLPAAVPSVPTHPSVP